MAETFLDFNHVGTESGTDAEPYNTFTEAEANSSAGDTIVYKDGDQDNLATTYHLFNQASGDARIFAAQNYRQAILKASDSQADYVGRTAGLPSASDNPQLWKGLVFDGQSGSGGSVTSAFQTDRDAVEDLTQRFEGCEFRLGSSYGLNHQMRRGRLELVDALFSGTVNGSSGRALRSSLTILAGDGNQTIEVNGIEFDLEEILAAGKVIELAKPSTSANALDLIFKAARGEINVGSVSTTLFDLVSEDVITYANFNLTVNVASGGSVTAMLARGVGAGNECANVNFINNTLRFNSDSGFGLAFGISQTDSHITGGLVSGNTVIGKYFPGATPHNIVMGQGTVGDCKGNVSRNGYVGFLLSITDDCNCIGNTAIDCYGPNIYFKGTVNATAKDNVCILSGLYTQRDRGVLSVAPQGAVNTSGATLQENLIIIRDVSKIHSLGYIEDINQTCSFVRNTYIIPDTVDIDTADLFSYHNGAGGAANNTLAEWNAQTEVTDDAIIQLPDSEISSLIASLSTSTTPVTGGIPIRSVIANQGVIG